jgi:hypothetical protein
MENIIDDDYNYVKENINNNNNNDYLNSENKEMEGMEIYPSEPSNYYEMNNDQPFNQNYYKINEENNNFNYNNNNNLLWRRKKRKKIKTK